MSSIQKILNKLNEEIDASPENTPLGQFNKYYPGADISGFESYTTHRDYSVYNTRGQQPITSNNDLREQEEDEENQEGRQGNEEEGGEQENPSDMMPDTGGEGKEEDYSASQIGRIYELNKIFSRILSLESYLSESGDQELLELRSYVSEAVDLFKVVIDNVDEFMEEIDDIIVMFYEFLQASYALLKKHYDKKRREKEKNSKNSKNKTNKNKKNSTKQK